MSPALAALALFAGSPQPADLAGLYIASQMEMGGAIELQPGGRFRYQLDYGAVSESAEGDWTLSGGKVLLTSNPMPKQPEFAVVRDDPAPAGELYVAVEDTGYSWSPLEVLVTLDGMDEPLMAYAEDDGRVAAPAGHRISSVKMLMPVYETGGDPVQLSADRGHRLLFRAQPNDIGRAAFRGEPLTIDGASLVMNRYEMRIVFRRSGQ